MDDYFQHVTESLGIEDLGILSILYDEDCVMRIKAMPNNKLYHNGNLSEAIYRRVLNKLLNTKLIEADKANKVHSYFISEYGKKAIENVLQLNK